MNYWFISFRKVMIPLHDTIPAQQFPFMNWAIIVINGIIFFMELTLSQETLELFFYHFGLVPVRYTDPQAAINASDTVGIAFWAHIGGFIAGAALFKIFSRK
jgi:membrane associated rhomboid family serine protease